MNSSIVNTVNSLELIAAKSPNSLIKTIIFTIGKLTVALPVEQVKKVIRKNAVYSSGLTHVHLTHIGEQEVTVVDLHQKLFKVSQIESENSKKYLIITKSLINEPLGIVVTETPVLLDIPIGQIRTIPNTYRNADTLGIASHVAVIPQEGESSKTIFILDLERLI